MRYLLILVLLLSTVTGCGFTIDSIKDSIVGTWYSDRDDQSKLTLTKQGTYSDGLWLTSGEYSVDDNDNKITLTSTLDGSNTLKIVTIDNNKVLFYGSGGEDSHIYYDNAEAAVTARQASEQTKIEQRAKAERKALETSLIGYWYSETFPIEFTDTNKFVSYAKNGWKEQMYELLSADTIAFPKLDGTESTTKIKLDDNHLTLYGIHYYKATRLDLSLDLLAGEWTNGTVTTVFTIDGTDTSKMTSSEFIDNNTISFEITNKDTIYVKGQQESLRAFLSETETEYQLILGETKNVETHTVLLRKKKSA